jgi:hypothetical protein
MHITHSPNQIRRNASFQHVPDPKFAPDLFREFAADSPLEGDGFELSVPREIARDIRAGD